MGTKISITDPFDLEVEGIVPMPEAAAGQYIAAIYGGLRGYLRVEDPNETRPFGVFMKGGAPEGSYLTLGNGPDWVYNSVWSHSAVDLGGGDDEYVSGAANDVVLGGNGNDTIRGADLAFGGAGNDRLDGGVASNTLYGDGGNDRIGGGAGNDRLDGGAGNDTVWGGAGDDRLFGGNGNDTLNGGAGNDTLNGGAGNDRYFGGAGSDMFVFAEPNPFDSVSKADADVVADFMATEDRLLFVGAVSVRSWGNWEKGGDGTMSGTLTVWFEDGSHQAVRFEGADLGEGSSLTYLTSAAGEFEFLVV